MTGQTDKSRHGAALWVVGIMLGLLALLGLAAGLYYELGKLEPNTIRLMATGAICLTPVMALLSLGLGLVFYRAKVSGLHAGIDTARDAWHEVSVGVGKVTQARQVNRTPHAGAMVVPYPYPVAQPGAGMVIDQRQVPDVYGDYGE